MYKDNALNACLLPGPASGVTGECNVRRKCSSLAGLLSNSAISLLGWGECPVGHGHHKKRPLLNSSYVHRPLFSPYPRLGSEG